MRILSIILISSLLSLFVLACGVEETSVTETGETPQLTTEQVEFILNVGNKIYGIVTDKEVQESASELLESLVDSYKENMEVVE